MTTFVLWCIGLVMGIGAGVAWRDDQAARADFRRVVAEARQRAERLTQEQQP